MFDVAYDKTLEKIRNEMLIDVQWIDIKTN